MLRVKRDLDACGSTEAKPETEPEIVLYNLRLLLQDEKRSGGPRTLLSILCQLAVMTPADHEMLVSLYSDIEHGSGSVLGKFVIVHTRASCSLVATSMTSFLCSLTLAHISIPLNLRRHMRGTSA